MFDKEKDEIIGTTAPETEEVACDCGDEDCDCNTITLELEDGTEKEFTVLDMLEHDGKTYMALAEEDSEEYDILRLEGNDEEFELLVIEDDVEYEKVADLFDEHFASFEEEAE
jgi:hypothetical protein